MNDLISELNDALLTEIFAVGDDRATGVQRTILSASDDRRLQVRVQDVEVLVTRVLVDFGFEVIGRQSPTRILYAREGTSARSTQLVMLDYEPDQPEDPRSWLSRPERIEASTAYVEGQAFGRPSSS